MEKVLDVRSRGRDGLIFWPEAVSRREFITRVLGRASPGHQLVDARGRPKIDKSSQHVSEARLRIDAVELASFDERGDAGPVLRALVVTGEQCVLAIEHEWTDAALDCIGIELNAAVIKEPDEAVPMMQGVADDSAHVIVVKS